MPLFVGLVLVLGLGGGAWVMFGGHGTRESPAANDSTHLAATHPDTSKTVQMPDTTKQAPPVTHTATNPVSLSRGDTVKPAPLSGSRPAGIDPSKAGDILDNLIDSPAGIIVDSAQVVYNTRGVSTTDKAFAACLIAQAQRTLRDREAALRWARIGLGLKSSMSSCQDVVQHPELQP
ncbi:MAG TPA: hypothetical protein VIV10_13170 [Gemmatimonadales bacterium]